MYIDILDPACREALSERDEGVFSLLNPCSRLFGFIDSPTPLLFIPIRIRNFGIIWTSLRRQDSLANHPSIAFASYRGLSLHDWIKHVTSKTGQLHAWPSVAILHICFSLMEPCHSPLNSAFHHQNPSLQGGGSVAMGYFFGNMCHLPSPPRTHGSSCQH